jgi:endonuclease I
MMYVRKPNVYVPNATYTASEWTATSVADANDANPGTHTLTPRPPGPALSHLVTNPSFPLAGSPVDVHADIVDTAAAITTVSLAWGTSPSTLSNPVAMSLLTGSTWGTVTPIPSQAAGSTVYYKVTANDAASGISVSDLQSYSLFYDLSIAQVQGSGPASPYAGSGAITHGVVTGVFGSYFTVQDGAGAWSGLWARGNAVPATGDSVVVRGNVTESDAQGYAGNTLLANAVVMSSAPAVAPPAPAVLPASLLLTEAYEGVLVTVAGGVCTNPNAGSRRWLVNDGSATATVDSLGFAFTPLLGTTYDVTGPLNYSTSAFRLEPRWAADVVWVADHVAPIVNAVGEMSETTFLVQFSEPVETSSAGTPANYSIAGVPVTAAVQDVSNPANVLVTLAGVPARLDTVIVNGVADAHANVIGTARGIFTYTDVSVPAGYYDSAIGLRGTALRAALHDIIKNHTVKSYDYAYTAYLTTDIKPNGKVWDMYSDVPGGTPPYEYDFSQNPGSGNEGSGFNREHSWPQAWFGGSVTPMYTDLWIIYPTDAKVNEYRSNYPYGPVGVASITSRNGTRLGPSSDPDYAGIVFEPIDAYKGDLARSTCYVATRYYTEDAGWPGGAAASGADLLPWAAALYTQWSANDPVSWKERLRNGAVFAIQHNRNPFVDHPEFLPAIFDSNSTAGVTPPAGMATRLLLNAPNPFRAATTIRFDLARRGPVLLAVYDVAGRTVRVLLTGEVRDAGHHDVRWDGRDAAGHAAPSGLYFYRLESGAVRATQRMVVMQ